jgi:excisionase family DNA binding protein
MCEVHAPSMHTTPAGETDIHRAAPSSLGPASTGDPDSRPLASTIGNDRLVLTVAEAGQLLGISRAFAYELVARGELPVIRLGRRIVVPKAALLAMVGLEPGSV